MLVEHFHQGWFCGSSEYDFSTPEEIKEYYKNRRREDAWYDIMWGSTHYDIKDVHFADNATKMIVKLKRA